MEGIFTTEEEDKGTVGFLSAQQVLPPLHKHFGALYQIDTWDVRKIQGIQVT